MKLSTKYSTTAFMPLPEYPRPLLERDLFYNLNGCWDYAITDTDTEPEVYDGKILVPFSPECSLSQVNRTLKPNEYLWYKKVITDPRQAETERLLLQFGAIDYSATVFLNHNLVTTHSGGYLPFTCDLSEYITKVKNTLVIQVKDLSDTSYHARGKQTLTPHGMFYPAQSGIWQTVFMERVPSEYVSYIKTDTDYDASCVTFTIETNGFTVPLQTEAVPVSESCTGPNKIEIYEEDQVLSSYHFTGQKIKVPLSHFHSWSPEDPFLYHVIITYGADTVKTYFAMRKLSVEKDSEGILRLMLNNKPYFHNGILDQGYFPESLYTPPSDHAMIDDILFAKKLGFNMLRKHAKIEPQRWYYHCDRLGMLVWQDFVNGGTDYHFWFVTYLAPVFTILNHSFKDNAYKLLSRAEKEGRTEFETQMQETVKALYNHPSIVTWTIFNEGWGQFDAKKMTQKLQFCDNTRFIDSASGWYDQKCGTVRSLHIYFTPMKFSPCDRPLVLSEFGGYTLPIQSHMTSEKIYGYRHYKTKKKLTDALVKVYEKKIIPGIKKGLCASVYTQLSDIEEEINGLITYDRKEIKINEVQLQKVLKSLR